MIKKLSLMVVCLIMMTACNRPRGERGIYHWKTTFDPNHYELDFLKTHHINRLYLRMFDVGGNGPLLPIATTRFIQPIPEDIEVVPVVFIQMGWNTEMEMSALADKIVSRVDKMMDSQNKDYHELQLDCDWNMTTREDFYELCAAARELMHQRGRTLSSTVRLWQSGQKYDDLPVDRCTLMMYNTGELPNYNSDNSIFSYSDIIGYLRNIRHSDRTYDLALPAFGWGVHFRNECYFGLLHETDYSDTSLYTTMSNNRYAVKRPHMVDGRNLYCGDIIRQESADIEEIKQVMDHLTDTPVRSSIIYHLDSANLSKYTYNEIETLLSY